jgi:IS30 family transposase
MNNLSKMMASIEVIPGVIKVTTRLIALIESKISEKWSPEQVSGWLRKDQSIAISYET